MVTITRCKAGRTKELSTRNNCQNGNLQIVVYLNCILCRVGSECEVSAMQLGRCKAVDVAIIPYIGSLRRGFSLNFRIAPALCRFTETTRNLITLPMQSQRLLQGYLFIIYFKAKSNEFLLNKHVVPIAYLLNFYQM